MAENKTLSSTFKSADTEEWLDVHFTRPIGLLWAKFFNYFGIHPNVVTIISIVLGAAAGVFFYFDNVWLNVVGILLLMWANFYDSADGQLARMTGKKTRWGRILDGFAGDVWFFCIYAAICLRLQDDFIPFTQVAWGIWIWLLCAFAGFVCHGKQCQLADYYRNIHLYFIKGESGSELDNSGKLTEEFDSLSWKHDGAWKLFLFFYRNYTRSQESMTHDFQSFKQHIDRRYGRALPAPLVDDFRAGSLPLLPYANILTFNTRAIVLYVSVLLGQPWIYPVFEITVMNILFFYMHSRHESLCRRLEDKYLASK
ncbi:MAG: CDP-alcohol phosphatidyltransferase family protein [Bacteroidaceae bacterium]|nr:CDP-alcohol phosphatidyltransferase family protein [Bacteroidaceae bacterium]